MNEPTKIESIGVWSGHFYLDESGVQKFQECTEKEFDALSLKDAEAPKIPGKYISSIKNTPKFNTVDGFPDELAYYDDGEVIIKKDGVLRLVVEEQMKENRVPDITKI